SMPPAARTPDRRRIQDLLIWRAGTTPKRCAATPTVGLSLEWAILRGLFKHQMDDTPLAVREFISHELLLRFEPWIISRASSPTASRHRLNGPPRADIGEQLCDRESPANRYGTPLAN